MDVQMNLSGMDAVMTALEAVENQAMELRRAVARLNAAAREVGIEISQPAAGTES